MHDSKTPRRDIHATTRLGVWIFVSLLGLAASLAAIGCSRVGRVDPASSTRLEGGLHAVRVRTSKLSLAGIPVASNAVATCFDPSQPDLDVAVVDSMPLADHTSAFPAPAGRSWRILWGSLDHFSANRLDSSLSVTAGDEVLLAGFDAEPSDYRRTAYWKRPIRVVRATLRSVREDGSVELVAPPGDYQCFRGGPAASRDPAGRWVVWGMVIARAGGDGDNAVLRAIRLGDVVDWLEAAKARAGQRG